MLPEAWGLLNKAYGITREAAGSGAIYVGKKGSDRAEIEAIIDGSDFADWQKARLKASENWYRDYTKMREDQRIVDARSAIIDFRNFVILNGILIEERLEVLLQKAASCIAEANEMRWAIAEEINYPDDSDRMKRNLIDAEKLLSDIRAITRNKLLETELLI